MPIRTIFLFSWPPGVKPQSLQEWLDTLSIEEQNEFARADQRQKAYREQAKIDGLMSYEENGNCYTWRDAEALETNKPTDDIWLWYWERYLKETQTIFTIEREEC